MSLDKAILSGKEKRNPYRDSRRVDYTCRNHKSCPWCRGTRTYKHRQQKQSADDNIRDYLDTL